MLFQIGVGQFQQAFRLMQQWGLIDVILPFALIFSILYSILINLGPDTWVKDNKKVAGIIAGSMTLLMIMPHVVSPSPNDMVSVINRSLPEIGLILVASVLVMIMTGVVGQVDQSWIKWSLPYLGIFLIGVIFYRALFPYQSPAFLNFISDPSLQALLIVLLVFGLVVYLVVGSSDDTEEEKKKKAAAAAGGQAPRVE